MSHKLIPCLLAGLVWSVCIPGARADDTAPPLFSFGGFGTFGVVHSTEHDADFVSSVYQPTGAGYSHAWSSDVDSLIAGQATANFSSHWSAVLQVIAQQNYDDTYRPHVEWFNIKYQFTPDFDIRAGRTALATFVETDSRKIGYAIPWVRPPPEVYSLSPVTSNDGLDASYRMHVGAATNTLQLTAGQSGASVPAGAGVNGGTVKSRGQLLIADTFERDFATLRLNYSRARIMLDQVNDLFTAFRDSGAEGTAIANRYDVNEQRSVFYGGGASYDPGHWFMMGEWDRVVSNASLGERTGWYVTGGYRIGSFTPYATYAEQTTKNSLSDPGFTVSELPPALESAAMNLLSALKSASDGQNTVSGGGRWDFMKNVSLKLQLDRTRLSPGSPGTLRNIQFGFQPGSTYTLFSATLDFVF